MSTLELTKLSKRFTDGSCAVHELDLSVDDGQFVVVLGPSGCGKSTLLRMVAGLEEPTTGDVSIDGVSVSGVGPGERNLALVSQHANLYPLMSVADNIGFCLRVANVHVDERTRRVREVARTLGLESVLEWRPRRLSGGQQQRVSIGRAMIRHPRLLLMDEPMSNLDAKLRTELRSHIRRLQRRLGITTFYVTHDQTEAMALADRLLVLRDGHVVQRGTPMEVYRRPVDLFVAQFVGSPAMTVLRAIAAPTPDGAELRIGRHSIRLRPHDLDRRPGLTRRLGRAADTEVGVGLRAEALRIAPEGEITASVDCAESHGSVHIVHATFVAHTVRTIDAKIVIEEGLASIATVQSTAPAVSRWEPIRFAVEVEELQLFDLVDGSRID